MWLTGLSHFCFLPVDLTIVLQVRKKASCRQNMISALFLIQTEKQLKEGAFLYILNVCHWEISPLDEENSQLAWLAGWGKKKNEAGLLYHHGGEKSKIELSRKCMSTVNSIILIPEVGMGQEETMKKLYLFLLLVCFRGQNSKRILFF